MRGRIGLNSSDEPNHGTDAGHVLVAINKGIDSERLAIARCACRAYQCRLGFLTLFDCGLASFRRIGCCGWSARHFVTVRVERRRGWGLVFHMRHLPLRAKLITNVDGRHGT